ncbi:MAG: hypothetical protein AAFX50_21405, partial [Acidobacteriota bacterium]
MDGDRDGGPEPTKAEETFLFDAFFSYATDPDRGLVRDTEAFLEALHRDPLVAPEHRRALEICVDGSDFVKPRRRAPATAPGSDPVFDLITSYMAQSARLVVFVGDRTRDHEWLNRELAWWLGERGPESVQLILTHGEDPAPEHWMPEPAARAEFGVDMWFDFRGGRRSTSGGRAVRLFEEERLRLAALISGPAVSASDIIKGWKIRDALSRRRKRRLRALTAAAFLIALTLLAFSGHRWWVHRQQAQSNLWAALSNAGSSLDPDRRLDTLAFGAAALGDYPSTEAMRGLTGTLSLLAVPNGSFAVDPKGRAVDALAFLSHHWIAAAGEDDTLRLFDRRDPDETVLEVKLPGRASAIAIDPA